MSAPKLTNLLGLPQPIVDAVRNDGYSKGDADISVTELISPPRLVALKHEHADKIEEDASDRIFSLLGQLMHGLLERANTTGVAERRLFAKINGWTVSGSMDAHYEHGLLQDYKLTTAYKFKGGKVDPQYEQQLNLYAVLLRKNKLPITKLEIVGVLRDWSKMEARRDAEYPQHQIIILPIPLWPAERAEAFMIERVQAHQDARKQMPLCSHEDRWAKPTTYAVMKQGAKRAVRVYETKEEAINHAAQAGDSFYVQRRESDNVRCENYCVVSEFCAQFKAMKASRQLL